MTASTSDSIMTVRLLASLRPVVGTKSIAVPTSPDATVRDLLRALPGTHAALAERVLVGEAELAPGIQVVINGRHIDFLQGLDTPLSATDDVVLVPPLAGG